jgi:competence protein ComEC
VTSDRVTSEGVNAYVLAASVAAGAVLKMPGPWPLAAVGLLLALALRRPFFVVLAAAVLASFLAANAAAAYEPVVDPFQHSGQAEIVSDPEAVGSGVRMDTDFGGRHLEAWAWGPQAARLRDRLAGERISISGRIEELPERAVWSRRRGIEGRLAVEEVGGWAHGFLNFRLANGIRRTLESGAAGLSDEQQSLFAGFVYGDDRRQSVLTADDFRAAGLTHLLAVSGQNVAFVLALVGPAVSRLGPRWRLLGILAVLLLFATITRFEPSVLRATAMAGVAGLGAALGRETSSRRILALAVTALLLLDPGLVGSLAFQLSVLASGGILFLSAPLARRIPGPRTFATALAVTAAAQIATAPLLVVTFGGVPVASLPANILAGPAAGPIMVWGMTAGLVAGLVGGVTATLIHLPTSLLLGWVQWVARAAALGSLGELRFGHLILIGVAAALSWLLRGQLMRRLSVAVLVGTFLLPAVQLSRSPALFAAVAPDSQIWRSGGAVVMVVGPDTRPDVLARTLRSEAIHRVDLAIFGQPGRTATAQLEVMRGRARIVGTLGLAPTQDAPVGSQITVGGLLVEVFEVEGDLEAQISGSAG